MPGTFTQVYIQVVFAVKGRENLIGKQWKDELHKYIAGIITVYNYILKQEEHHRKKTFKEEYIEFLKKFEIEYNEKYLFDWIE